MKVILLILLVAAIVRPAAAQGTPLSSLRTGDTIRVWAVDPPIDGRFGIFDARLRDTLRFTDLVQPPVVSLAVALPSVRHIAVKRGIHRSPARIFIGTVLGAAAGAAAGAVLGRAMDCGACNNDDDFEGLGGLVFGGALGLVVGGTTGAIITRRPTPRWEAVDPRR